MLSKYFCRPRLCILKLLIATGSRAKVFSILVSWHLTILDRQVFSFFFQFIPYKRKHLRRAKIESRCAKDPKDHSYHLTIVLWVTSLTLHSCTGNCLGHRELSLVRRSTATNLYSAFFQECLLHSFDDDWYSQYLVQHNVVNYDETITWLIRKDTTR